MATRPEEPTEIDRTPVESTLVHAIGYNAGTAELDLEFRTTGSVRRYREFPGSAYAELMTAPSIGAFYNRVIKGRFQSEELTGVCPKCGDHGWRGRRCDDCGTDYYFPEEKHAEVRG